MKNAGLFAAMCFSFATLVAQGGTCTFLIRGEPCRTTVSDTEVAVKTSGFSKNAAARIDPEATVETNNYWSRITFSASSASAEDTYTPDSLEASYVSPVLEDSGGGKAYVRSSILISFPAGTDDSVVSAYVSGISGMTSYSLISSPTLHGRTETASESAGEGYDIYEVKLNTSSGYSVLNTVSSLSSNPGQADTIMPDLTIEASMDSSNDPYYDMEWYLDSDTGVDAVDAWDTTMGSSSVRVAVIDCGIEDDHPDLNVAGGINCTPYGDEDQWYATETNANHATTVAGVICATTNNSVGIASVAPNVSVYSIKTSYDTQEDGSFSTDASKVIEGIEWAAEQGCRITNCSWTTTSTELATMIDRAFENTRISNEMLHFASSGNSNTSSISAIASGDDVIAVGGTNSSGSRWTEQGTSSSGSQYGEGLDLVAPAQNIWTTDRAGSLGYGRSDYYECTGTSYASPIAAACAALVLSKNPGLTADEVEEILEDTATDLGTTGWDEYYGYGLVNVSKALDAVDPYVFFDAYDAGDGWKCDSVYGWVYDVSFPYFWHTEHGWQYAGSSDPDSFIVYDYTCADWFWTSIGDDGVYPYIYRYGTDTWYYYYEGTTGPREFMNMTTDEVENF